MILSGSICALATPFRSHGDEIDFDAFGRLIDHQLAGGTCALAVAGSTGEAAALDDAEFSALLEFAVGRVAGRVPVLAGTGMSATRKTIARTQIAKATGVDIALVVAPAYVRPTQEGMYRHFCEVAGHGGLRVLLYNVPSRTSCDLLPATVTRLAASGNIIGIKEAVSTSARLLELLPLARSDFCVLSGDDPRAKDWMLAGANGVVSVAANVAPRLFASLCDAAAAHDGQRAAEIDEKLSPLYALLGVEPNPIPVKWCLSVLGIGDARLRLPLIELSRSHRARGVEVMRELGLIENAAVVG